MSGLLCCPVCSGASRQGAAGAVYPDLDQLLLGAVRYECRHCGLATGPRASEGEARQAWNAYARARVRAECGPAPLECPLCSVASLAGTCATGARVFPGQERGPRGEYRYRCFTCNTAGAWCHTAELARTSWNSVARMKRHDKSLASRVAELSAALVGKDKMLRDAIAERARAISSQAIAEQATSRARAAEARMRAVLQKWEFDAARHQMRARDLEERNATLLSEVGRLRDRLGEREAHLRQWQEGKLRVVGSDIVDIGPVVKERDALSELVNEIRDALSDPAVIGAVDHLSRLVKRMAARGE